MDETMTNEPSCDSADLRPEMCQRIDELLGDTTLQFRFDVLSMCIYAGLAMAPDDERAGFQAFVKGFISLPVEVHCATPARMQQLIREAADPATQVAVRGRELMSLLGDYFNLHAASAYPIGMLSEFCVHVPVRERAKFRREVKTRLDKEFYELERMFPAGPPTAQDVQDSMRMRGQLIETLRLNRKVRTAPAKL